MNNSLEIAVSFVNLLFIIPIIRAICGDWQIIIYNYGYILFHVCYSKIIEVKTIEGYFHFEKNIFFSWACESVRVKVKEITNKILHIIAQKIQKN